MDRIDVWCPEEQRVIGSLPADIGLITLSSFWIQFRPATSEYRLTALPAKAGVAHCPRCHHMLEVAASSVEVTISAAEHREIEERCAMARAQYGDGKEIPSRAQLRAELERHPIATGAVLLHFEHLKGDQCIPIIFGSTRIK